MGEGWFHRVIEPGDAYCAHRHGMCDFSFPGDSDYPADDVSDDLRGGTRRAVVMTCACGGIWRIPLCEGMTLKGDLCKVQVRDSEVHLCRHHALETVSDARLGGARCNAVKMGTDERCKMAKLSDSDQWCYYHAQSQRATVHPSVTTVEKAS